MNDRYLLTPRYEGANAVYLDVLIALSPVIAWSVYLYGIRPVTLLLIAVLTVALTDTVFGFIYKKRFVTDLSSAVTGSVIALALPASAPLWLPAAAGLMGGIVKNALGIKKSPVSPPALSIVLCHLIFPKLMSAIPKSRIWLDALSPTVKVEAAGVSSLDTVLAGPIPEANVWGEFFGIRSGTIGEASAFLLICGLIYLCVRRISRPSVAISYLLTVAVATYIKPTLVAATDFVAIRGALFNIFGSTTMLCAVFFAADLPSAPKNQRSAIIGGVVGGIATVALRYTVGAPLSAPVGIRVLNIVSLGADRLLPPSPFGGTVKKS